MRDLKLGDNELSGPLDGRISSLQKLETLDLKRNALTALPEGLAELVHLRVLNITENGMQIPQPFDYPIRIPREFQCLLLSGLKSPETFKPDIGTCGPSGNSLIKQC